MAPVKTSANGSRIRKKIPTDGKVMTEDDLIRIYHVTKSDLAYARRIVDEVVHGKPRHRRRKPIAKARHAAHRSTI